MPVTLTSNFLELGCRPHHLSCFPSIDQHDLHINYLYSRFILIECYFVMCIPNISYSLNKKEWICSLFKEWILEKSEIRVNLEWTFVLFTHFGVTSGITRNPWVIPEVTPKWVNNTNVHSKFTIISLFSNIHSLKSEHIHSFLFREYIHMRVLVDLNEFPSIFKKSAAFTLQTSENSLKPP